MTARSTPVEAATMPLFYRSPAVLRALDHFGYALAESEDYDFTRSAGACSLTVGEFAAAACDYPIVFSAGPTVEPLVVLGVKENVNLFSATWKAEKDNTPFARRRYIPAYVRRYPFLTVKVADKDILGIDTACERFTKKAGQSGCLLFDEAGEPTQLTKDMMAFCHAFLYDVEKTTKFCEAVSRLLRPSRAVMTFEDRAKYSLDGFQVIDESLFARLKGEALETWHQEGWIGLAHYHIASQRHWQSLISIHDHVSATDSKSAAAE